MIAYTILAIYLVVGLVMNVGMLEEYKRDQSGELDGFSPTFIKFALTAVSLFWPLLMMFVFINWIKEKI